MTSKQARDSPTRKTSPRVPRRHQRAATKWRRCSSSKRKTSVFLLQIGSGTAPPRGKSASGTAATAMVTGLTRTRERVKSSAFRAYNILWDCFRGFALHPMTEKLECSNASPIRNDKNRIVNALRVHVIAKFQKTAAIHASMGWFCGHCRHCKQSILRQSKFTGLFNPSPFAMTENWLLQGVPRPRHCKVSKKPPQSMLQWNLRFTVIASTGNNPFFDKGNSLIAPMHRPSQ